MPNVSPVTEFLWLFDVVSVNTFFSSQYLCYLRDKKKPLLPRYYSPEKCCRMAQPKKEAKSQFIDY